MKTYNVKIKLPASPSAEFAEMTWDEAWDIMSHYNLELGDISGHAADEIQAQLESGERVTFAERAWMELDQD